MKKILIAAISLFCAETSAHADTITKTFNSAEINQLALQNGKGKVKISATEATTSSVTANKVKFGKDCTLTIEKSGTILVVKVNESSWFFQSDCEVNLDIQVPREVTLDLQSGSGAIQVRGTKGNVVYKLGSGEVDLDAEITTIEGKAGSGTIRVNGLTGNGTLKTGSGNITVTYLKKPERGSLDITTGSGNAAVFLPANTQVKSTFKSGSGQMSNELGDSPDAAFAILATAGSGSLSIKKTN